MSNSESNPDSGGVAEPGATSGTPPSNGGIVGRIAKAISLIEGSFPEKLTPFVWLAMGVGSLLICLALFGSHVMSWKLHAVESLLVGSGIAIILAAFGGQATVHGRVYVLAGVAALAAILIVFLEYRRDLDITRNIEELNARKKQYVRGFIHEVPAREYTIFLRFVHNVPADTDLKLSKFAFVVVRGEALESKIASLTLEDKNDETNISSIPISTSCIIDSTGREEPLEWELRKDGKSYELFDRRREMVIGRFPNRDVVHCKSDVSFDQHSTLFAAALLSGWRAFAQATPSGSPPTSPVDLESISADLKSLDTEIRRSARDILSGAPPEQVPAILELLRRSPNSYRTKVGIAVALTEMLRRNKNLRENIVPLLDDSDRELLLDLAGGSDRTLRIYASEFLFDLGDPGITRLAIPRAAQTSDDNARYNWLLVAQDGWWRLGEDAKESLRTHLDSAKGQSGEKTLKLFEKLQ